MITFNELQDNIEPALEQSWKSTLPVVKPKKNQFILDFDWNNTHIYVCVRELFWHETMDIEAQSFRTIDDGSMYLAGEFERRETLSRALVWITEQDGDVKTNEDGTLLTKLQHEVIENLWDLYQPHVIVGAQEAAELYNAASKYFSGAAQSGHPTPSLIIEVDMMIKFGGMNRKELRKVPTSEMERMQIIFMARSEVLGLTNNNAINITTPSQDIDNTQELLQQHINMPNSRFMQPNW